MTPETVSIDIAGAALSTPILRQLMAQAMCAKGGTVTLVIENVSRGMLPNLIADYGDMSLMFAHALRKAVELVADERKVA